MFQTWDWVSGLGTKIMINVLVNLPVSSANINQRNYFQQRTTIITNNTIYFFFKIKTVRNRSFSNNTIIFSKKSQGFPFSHECHEFDLGRILEHIPTFKTINNLILTSWNRIQIQGAKYQPKTAKYKLFFSQNLNLNCWKKWD